MIGEEERVRAEGRKFLKREREDSIGKGDGRGVRRECVC